MSEPLFVAIHYDVKELGACVLRDSPSTLCGVTRIFVVTAEVMERILPVDSQVGLR